MWALELDRDEQMWTLAAGGPAAVIEDARRSAVRVHLRVKRRATVWALDRAEEEVPVSDLAFHRHTRQSTHRQSDDPIGMIPTAPERAPWRENGDRAGT